jgi:uncharacterized CHY-type Zn-finger protein
LRQDLDSASAQRPIIRGGDVDAQTRCRHYHGPTDIIAIKMKCCGEYYACKDCHEELASHAIKVWPRAEWPTTKAILCGNCSTELTIAAYLASNSSCPNCSAAFNPRCSNHYHFYFETPAPNDRAT